MPGFTIPPQEANLNNQMIQRTPPEPDKGRAELVKKWCKRVTHAKEYHKDAFKRMRDCMKFARGLQWPNQTKHDDRYVLNFTARHLKQSTATLYAKNPTVKARRRPRLDYALWDGQASTLMEAASIIQGAQAMVAQGVPVDPSIAGQVQQAADILRDYSEGKARQQERDKFARTLEILQDYFLDEQISGFKQQMKHMVRRERTTGIGWIKIDFQRINEPPLSVQRELADYQARLNAIQRMSADIKDGEVDPEGLTKEELEQTIRRISEKPMILREGLVYSWPGSTSVILSPHTRKLAGLTGCDWLAEECFLSTDQVKEIYGVDVQSAFTRYNWKGERPESHMFGAEYEGSETKDSMACVWEVYDKTTGTVFTVVDGYPDFLEEPRCPNVDIEGFFQHVPLAMNEIEGDELYPQSDVYLLKHPQRDVNRSREARRQHRHAARPLYVSPKGSFQDEELQTLAGADAHSVLSVAALQQGQKANELVQPLTRQGLDPNLYEIGSTMSDAQLATGSQEAQFGNLTGATATESSISQNAQNKEVESSGDDLDMTLTEVMRKSGQVLMAEMSEESVKTIVGPGAYWPTRTMEEIRAEIYLEVQAGSSGKPNRAAEISNFQQMFQFLSMIPGINLTKLGEYGVGLLSDHIEVADFMELGAPSIMQLNNMTSNPGSGEAGSNPETQGIQGSTPERGQSVPRQSALPGNPAPGATPGDQSASG